MIAGALILLAGIAIGWLLRSLPGRRKGPKPIEAVCGCGHHHPMHGTETGECNASVQVSKYSKSGNWIGYDHKPCACVRYSGPEPLPSFYATEIASEAGQ